VDEAFTSKYTQNGLALALMRNTLPPCFICNFSRSAQDCKCLVIPRPEMILSQALQTPLVSIAILQTTFLPSKAPIIKQHYGILPFQNYT
jgi:hypothetical protein